MKRTVKENSLARPAERAAKLSFWVTVVVVLIKMVAGWLSGAVSVQAEAVQSLVDVIVSFGAWQSIQYAARPPDETHNYGHGKAEVLMSAIQVILILGTAVFMAIKAYERLTHPQSIETGPALVGLLLSSCLTLGVSFHLAKVAKQTGSASLHSEVLHLRSDLIATGGVFVGMAVVALTGWIPLDGIVAIVLSVVVVFLALRQGARLAHDLMDGALPPDDIALVEKILDTHPMVKGAHNIRTRRVGSTRFVEMHVLLEDELTFVAAHDLAEEIEGEVASALGRAVVTIHYEPYLAELSHRAQAHGETV